jgi:hypothetical protein
MLVPIAGPESRALPRRHLYLGEGVTFALTTDGGRLEAEAVDLTPEGLGLATTPGQALPAFGDAVTVRCTARGGSHAAQQAIVRHVGWLRHGGRVFRRIGLALERAAAAAAVDRRTGVRHLCPDALPAFATASCPWLLGERLRFRIRHIGAGGMTLVTRLDAPLLPGLELDLELHLAHVGIEPVRGRLTSVRRADGGRALEVGAAWVDPSRALSAAIANYLLAGDDALTPASLRSGGLAVGSVEPVVTYDYARTPTDFEDILALRLAAHQAEGHLADASIADMRSPFDAHARHLTCRFGGRIVGYVRVIFVDRIASRSQYVTLGGHEVPPWLWAAGFVEAGAGAIHHDFQRAGLFVPLMMHSVRVAVQSGHRYVLGACDDGLLGMYQAMGFAVLEERIVEPSPGWRFRSHLILLDAERLVAEAPASKTLAAMASAAGFAGLPVAA